LELPFGLTNALAYFVDLMNRVFKSALISLWLYLYSKTREEHVEHVRLLLKTLKEDTVYAKFKKYEFWLDEVHFVGHVVTKEGISVDLAMVKAILNGPRLTCVTQVQSFLGMVSCYRRIVEGFSKLSVPITKLL